MDYYEPARPSRPAGQATVDRPSPGRRPSAPGQRQVARPWDTRRVLGMVVYGLACAVSLLILVTSGFGYFVYSSISNIGSSNAIGDNTPKSKDGAVNILLIGLDSRKDLNGNPLPQRILGQLHAGSAQGVNEGNVGGYNTNTLIVMHVPNDGSKVTAFSIPRDDYVDYVDAIGSQQRGKIKEAYGVTKFFKEQQLVNAGVHDHKTLEHKGREAARHATIRTVEKLLGVPIDHFAEVNLAGFYDLATALGGVDVCLKKPVKDHWSGADFPAGKQHLNGSQALAFVRQRHGLTNGDLDRTHRQQAFLASVTHKLKQQGLFGNLAKMQSLLQVAKKDVVLDVQWDVLAFAQQAQGLTGGNVEFHTLPVKDFVKVRGQDVNLVDPIAIRAMVQDAIGPKKAAGPAQPGGPSAPAGPASTVDVLNAGGRPGLAAKVASALSSGGYITGTVGNTPVPRTKTMVRYGTGGDSDAKKIASLFGVTAAADPALMAGHVEIDLGKLATVPHVPAAGGKKPVMPAAPATHKPVAIPTDGISGGAVKGGGIPCVN